MLAFSPGAVKVDWSAGSNFFWVLGLGNWELGMGNWEWEIFIGRLNWVWEFFWVWDFFLGFGFRILGFGLLGTGSPNLILIPKELALVLKQTLNRSQQPAMSNHNFSSPIPIPLKVFLKLGEWEQNSKIIKIIINIHPRKFSTKF